MLSLIWVQNNHTQTHITSAATVLLEHDLQCSVGTGSYVPPDLENARRQFEWFSCYCACSGCSVTVWLNKGIWTAAMFLTATRCKSQDYGKSLASVVSQQLQIKGSSEMYIEVLIPYDSVYYICSNIHDNHFSFTIILRPKDYFLPQLLQYVDLRLQMCSSEDQQPIG